MAGGKRKEEFQTELEGYKELHPPTSFRQEEMKKNPPLAKKIPIAKPPKRKLKER